MAGGGELTYILLLSALFLLPRLLARRRIPGAVTSVLLGVAAGAGLGLFRHDPTVGMLATLGIVSLFLAAGIEVDTASLRLHRTALARHLAIAAFGMLVVARLAAWLFDLPVRPALLLSLALMTPSAGFILTSIESLPFRPGERFWVRTKAISSELLALFMLFVVVQSASFGELARGVLVLAAMLLGLPVLFRTFVTRLAPHAPRSEFAFIVILAVSSAFLTRHIGVYYLVGAFVVGLVAERFGRELPTFDMQQIIGALEVFGSIFIPFYFFKAGLEFERGHLSWNALRDAGLFLSVIPLRIGVIALERHLFHREHLRDGVRIGSALTPTLVFTLVIAQILRERFGVSEEIYGGLVIYALATTIVPVLVLRTPPPDYESIDIEDERSSTAG